MSRRIHLTVLAAAALLLTSCATASGEPTTQPTEVDRTAPMTGDGPLAFLDRETLPSCGEYTLEQGEQYPAEAVDCLIDAIGVDGAELVVTMPTTEGDPVVTWFRALPEGGIETWTDLRRDKFAGEGVSWEYSLCPDATSLEDSGDCTHQSYGMPG